MTKWNLVKAKEYVKSVGSKMIADEWFGTKGFYYFKCIECGEWKYTAFHNIKSGNLKCKNCGTKKGHTTVYVKKCKKCGVEFTSSAKQKYCSDECRGYNCQYEQQKINSNRKDITEELLVDLYMNKRIPAIDISIMLGVSKGVILRRLHKYNIEVRTSQESKHEVEFVLPTKEELEELYIKQFLPFNKICQIYKVSMSLIIIWMKKYKIPVRKASITRLGKDFKEPTKDELIELYIDRGMNSKDIGSIYGTDGQSMVRRMRGFGIKIKDNTFGNSAFLLNGIKVKSSYEKIVGDILCLNNIKFEYEPQLPFNHHYHADFLIGDIYVEIWGVVGSKKYENRKNIKKNLYKENNLNLFELYPCDFKKDSSKIRQLISLVSSEYIKSNPLPTAK